MFNNPLLLSFVLGQGSPGRLKQNYCNAIIFCAYNCICMLLQDSQGPFAVAFSVSVKQNKDTCTGSFPPSVSVKTPEETSSVQYCDLELLIQALAYFFYLDFSWEPKK